MVAQSSSWYDAHAADLVHRYELIDPTIVYGWLTGVLSDTPGTVLDVGAGSGRDAAWFAAQGHDVVAVDPSSRRASQGYGPTAASGAFARRFGTSGRGSNVCRCPQAVRLLKLRRIDLVRRRYQPSDP